MESDQNERLHAELQLLEAMYPNQTTFSENARELKYTSDTGSCRLRLPEGYPQNQLPEVLSATDGQTDLRERLRRHVKGCSVGEEVLDEIFAGFEGFLGEEAGGGEVAKAEKGEGEDDGKATVVVWLHHLLNTNKRKQALNPPFPGVSGVTKPGYPGVLVYSGPARAVHEHVNELKGLNWAAFQVRLESEEEWSFGHGGGVVEVEAMKQVVAEVGEGRKEVFMEAMRMK